MVTTSPAPPAASGEEPRGERAQAGPARAGTPSGRHEQLRREVRKWAREEVAPRVAAMEASQEVDRELLAAAARKGWIGVTIGPEFGGMGLDHTARTIVIEELSRVSGAVGAAVQASILGTAKIIHWGSAEQRRVWLPLVASGACLPTIAVTEGGSGGHVLGMRATARRDGTDWVINGAKSFVGNSHVATMHGVVVRTGGAGARALSAFLVPAGTPGLSLRPHPATLGLHGFSFGDLVFEECRVPADAMVGAEGDGLEVALSSSILYGRPNLAAVALGIHRAISEATIAYAGETRRYGRPLADLDSVRTKIAAIASHLTTARTLAYQAVAMLDQGLPCDIELMNAKLVGAELGTRSALLGMQVHGAAGLRTGRPVERLLRDMLHTGPPAGTSDIQLLRIGQDALGQAPYEQMSVRFGRPPAAPPRGGAA
ncbi:acyl-CoA dehydrogenase family protein [Actinacidiphila sp. ITFR-21]|uniref:acyl-CoA dehydrogenase family protein n=1 Tax=Actinacidiphila sp. ITFR-21 TaxID=3075199 RepID=UPI00288B6D5A|nr:acyl-CoA dehydrogenase family protein [Streptomyces sp. ITFR-21]WNI19965.1 acyl-CoA dehydrogenase family protein [Streptomyces sp. ITFR-21]